MSAFLWIKSALPVRAELQHRDVFGQDLTQSISITKLMLVQVTCQKDASSSAMVLYDNVCEFTKRESRDRRRTIACRARYCGVRRFDSLEVVAASRIECEGSRQAIADTINF